MFNLKILDLKIKPKKTKKVNLTPTTPSKKRYNKVPDYIEILNKSRANKNIATEVGVRTRLISTFLNSSHGQLKTFTDIHLEAIEKDPIFYGHLARWYSEKGTIRDHNELFAAHLLTSPFPDHRENGFVLLQFLRPYQVKRVVKYCKETLNYPTRALKSAIIFYLTRREKNTNWFDEHVIRDKQSIKFLYSSLHIKPSERAEQILFQEKPPQDSRVYYAKMLSKLRSNPEKQAELILKHKIHFTTALGSVATFTPSLLFALASVMTPQQVINNLKFFEKRGALNNYNIMLIVNEKIQKGISESRVSDFKSLRAVSEISNDSQIAEKLLDMTQKRLLKRGKINEPTAIFVDKSGSMSTCIKIGKLLAVLCSSIAQSDIYVYAFDSNSFEINPDEKNLSSWNKAFEQIIADGSTSIGAPFTKLANKKVSQILVISDGEENVPPFFADMLKKYEEENEIKCKVIFLKVNNKANTSFEDSLKGRDYMTIPFNGDYYTLPNIIPLLCAGNDFELIEEIMSVPLFTKGDLLNLPPGFDEENCEIL